MTSTDQTEFVEEGLQCLYLENKTCSFFPPLLGQNWLEKAQKKNQKKIQTCILLQYSFDQFQMGIPTKPTLTPSSPWSLGSL